MNLRVSNNAAFADFAALRLELRLDQRDQMAAGARQVERGFEYLGEADEAGIAGDDIDRLGHDCGAEAAGVGLLVDDDAVVAAQFPGQLVGADVDRIDAGRAAGQQHIGEAAGRASDIERDGGSHVDREMVEPVGQLDPAARHPRMIAALDRQRGVVGEQIPRLGHSAVTGIDGARKDQRLCAGPAFGEALGEEEQVGAGPGHSSHEVRRSRPSRLRPRGHCGEGPLIPFPRCAVR